MTKIKGKGIIKLNEEENKSVEAVSKETKKLKKIIEPPKRKKKSGNT